MKMVLNNSTGSIIPITDYTRNTSLEGDQIISRATITLNPTATSVNILSGFFSAPITSINILDESNESIYQLTNISGNVTSMFENVNNDNVIASASLVVNMGSVGN